MHGNRVSSVCGRVGLLLVVFVLSGAASASAEERAALNGYCPVSYFKGSEPVKGREDLARMCLGLRYHFSSEEALAEFEKNPTKYIPQFGGMCTTALGGSYGNRFYGEPSVYYVRDSKLYLFSSMRARNAFDRRPQKYIDSCKQLFLGAKGYCPVSFQRDGKAVPGKEELMLPYGYYSYQFADEAARDEFLKNPEKYVPQYGGFCAHAVSRGKAHPGDASAFAVIDGKTCFFWDVATRDKFLEEKDALIAKADEQWESLKVESLVRVSASSKPRVPMGE